MNRNEKIPLIINTMGWNQGLGLCLLKESILIFKPNHVIQINHPIEANKNMPVLDRNWLKTSNGWPPLKQNSQNQTNYSKNDSENASDIESSTFMDVEATLSDQTYKLYTLKSAVPSSKVQSSNSVLKEKISKKNFSPRDHRNIATLAYFSKLQDSITFKTIHNLKPYKIAWSKICLHVSHMKIDYSQLLKVFNASLIGLCQVDPKYVT